MIETRSKLTSGHTGRNRDPSLPTMAARRRWIIVVLAAMSAVASAHAEHYRVYLLGGQSNGNGRGDALELTAPLNAPQTDVLFYWHKTQVTPNGNLTQDTWIDLQAGSGHGINSPSSFDVEFGSELSFGRILADTNASVNIAIIKYTHGGTSLHTHWAEGGGRYTTFVSTVEAGLAALTAAGHTYEMGGMIWIQGESDTEVSNASNYETNLNNLIVRVRRDVFGGPSPGGYTLPFVISGLSDSQYGNITTPGTGSYIVRQAQESVAANVRQAAFVNTDGFSTYGTVHFDATGQIAIGEACVDQILLVEANDADRDGLLLDEEATLGTNPNMPDTDGDGQYDGVEFAAGTVPTNSTSFFQVESVAVTNGFATLVWPSKPGNRYMVEQSGDLANWSVVAANYPAVDPGSNTTWTGTTGGISRATQVLARYDAETGSNGDFDTAAFDSVDTETLTTASRISQGGGLTGGGSSLFVLNHALFNTSDSGSPGFNLADCHSTDQTTAVADGDYFSFDLQPNGGSVTYEALSFYADQFRTSAKVDVSYRVGANPEVFALQNFTPVGSNADVVLQSVDFANFTTDETVTLTFYLYGAAASTHGIRFDDITLTGRVDSGEEKELPPVSFWRISLTDTTP